MSLPALIGFAGVLVAAVATGLLAGRAVRRPRLDTILWTGATLALTVALAAQSMGFARGFGPPRSASPVRPGPRLATAAPAAGRTAQRPGT